MTDGNSALNEARALLVYGGSLLGSGNATEAELAFNEAKRLVGSNGAGSQKDNAEHVRAVVLMKFADLLVAKGDRSGAEANYRQCIAVLQRTALDPNGTRDLSICYERTGDFAAERGEFPAAAGAFQESLKYAKEAAEKGHGLVGRPGDVPRLLAKSGDALVNASDRGAGIPLLETAVKALADITEPDRIDLLQAAMRARGSLARAYQANGQREDAIRTWEEAIRVGEIVARQDPGNRASIQDIATALTAAAGLVASGGSPEDRTNSRWTCTCGRRTGRSDTWISELMARL